MGWKRSKFSSENQKFDPSRKIILLVGLVIFAAVYFINSANSSARTSVGFHNLFHKLVSINRTKKFAAVDKSAGTVFHTDFNALDKAGNSAFFNAVQYGRNASFLTTLIIYGMNRKTRNNNNDTALRVAALHGNLQAANLLISMGADVKDQNVNGQTPLHLALLSSNVSQNMVGIVSKLVKSGAKVDILDKHGESVRQLANRIVPTNEQMKNKIINALSDAFIDKSNNFLDELDQLSSNSDEITHIPYY